MMFLLANCGLDLLLFKILDNLRTILRKLALLVGVTN